MSADYTSNIPFSLPQSIGSKTASAVLADKIAELEVRRMNMKARNTAWRNAKLSSHIPHEPFEFRNLSANIRRTREQLAKVQAADARRETAATEGDRKEVLRRRADALSKIRALCIVTDAAEEVGDTEMAGKALKFFLQGNK